ncbi:trypsin-like [Zerene cesonia]|uniref:trypsin-like n=1 Tax=Zerene cesonia TaxID=33412 RepID=UPI0018E57138|nr:trypsin-like [Zerene cesonia]
MAAILKKSVYISAGALIDESWIVTGADSLYMLRDLSRVLRVRLGSINYKKGGVFSPIKLFHIHPLFDDNQPQYDVALIKLAEPVRLTPSLNPIQLLKKLHDVAVTHFIVTGWMQDHRNSTVYPLSMESIKRRRLLTVSHVHPTNAGDCFEQLEVQGINNTGGVMCLDPPVGGDPCQRDIGAPVVLNGVLWGIISSWRSEDCEVEAGSTFVTLVSHVDVSSWIHATIHGHRWTRKHVVDYDDNFI